MNSEQAKHLANGLRMLGVAQFALYGYTGLTASQTDWLVVGFSGLVYALLEGLAFWLLGRVSK